MNKWLHLLLPSQPLVIKRESMAMNHLFCLQRTSQGRNNWGGACVLKFYREVNWRFISLVRISFLTKLCVFYSLMNWFCCKYSSRLMTMIYSHHEPLSLELSSRSWTVSLAALFKRDHIFGRAAQPTRLLLLCSYIE